MSQTRVLFLCTGNSARSQMAEAFLRKYAGDRFEAHSAGLEPKGLNPLTIQVMDEIGMDMYGHTSKASIPISERYCFNSSSMSVTMLKRIARPPGLV